jgi:hypothetical protein
VERTVKRSATGSRRTSPWPFQERDLNGPSVVS